MPKAEWGVKRTCPSCDSRFYDLRREPILCPECGTTFSIDDHGKVLATRERRVPAPVAAASDEALVDDEPLVEEDDADDEDLLGEDEDEDDAPSGPALAEEDDETAVAFDDNTLMDEGDVEADDDEDEDDIEDDDDLGDLDDVAGKAKGG